MGQAGSVLTLPQLAPSTPKLERPKAREQVGMGTGLLTGPSWMSTQGVNRDVAARATEIREKMATMMPVVVPMLENCWGMPSSRGRGTMPPAPMMMTCPF